MKLLSVCVGALVLVIATGCGAGTPSARPTSTGSQSESPGPAPSPSAGPSAVVPTGWRLITGGKSKISFAIPKSWSKLDANRLKVQGGSKLMDDYAKGPHVTTDQLRQLLAHIEVMAISPILTAKEYGEVEVVPVPILGELPTEEALRAQFDALGLRTLGFRDVKTGVGAGVVAAIRKVLPDSSVIYSEAAFLRLRSGIVGVTVSARSDERARALLDLLLPSISDAGEQPTSSSPSAL